MNSYYYISAEDGLIRSPTAIFSHKAESKKTMLWERTNVECHSGYKRNEYPLFVSFQGRRCKITDIVDRWYEGGLDPGRPALYYYKVRNSDGTLFLLRYDPLFDKWFLHALT